MYLTWNNKTTDNFSDANINALYNEGYLFTRAGKGAMYQSRSLRIDLSKFEPSSENKRVLRKNEAVELIISPLPYADYHWSIGKLGKDFYETKFGPKTMSANKIKELLTDEGKSNFNKLFIYSWEKNPVGYCICLETNDLVHYCYPFYQISNIKYPISNLGIGMMTKAIMWAKEQGKKYIYLGSAQRPTDTYKLQFEGLEWFDGKSWQTDQQELKNILKV